MALPGGRGPEPNVIITNFLNKLEFLSLVGLYSLV
jgi:hypothetical protein